MYIYPYVQYLLFLPDFNKCWIFSAYHGNLLKKVHKNSPVAEELFHADTQTDGRTVRQNDVNCPLSYFCERA